MDIAEGPKAENSNARAFSRNRQSSGEPGSNRQRHLRRQAGSELSIIVPTYNERENIAELVRRLDDSLADCSWEVIFVDDDSPDGTSDLVREIAQRDVRIRCVQRINRRGLASACVEGILASSAPYVAVIDADLQHDETLLPRMLDVMKTGNEDVVVGSRYVSGGGIGEWDAKRAHLSQYATWISRSVLRVNLRDPMSGFFMMRREAFMAAVRNLSTIGFKILLDLFASSPRPLSFRELPYQFRSRYAGESKLDNRAKFDYGMLLLDKLIGQVVPIRFVAFGLVGSIGIFVHLAAVTLLFKGLQLGFMSSQFISSIIAMTTNFILNNIFTYHDLRLSGWRWLRGWVTFVMACIIGTIANVGIATYLFERDAGWTMAAVAGIVVGAVWNYATTRVYTWGIPKK